MRALEEKLSVDFYQHVDFNVKCLKRIGLWVYIPHQVNSVQYWFAVLIRVCLGTLVCIISTGGQIVYLGRLILTQNYNILDVTGIANLIVTEMLVELKLLDMRLRREHLLKLIEAMNSKEFECHNNSEKVILEKAIKASRFMFKIIAYCTSMDVFVHAVVVPALEKFTRLPLKMDLIFFDVNDPRYFNYVCAYQILYKPIMLATFVTLQTFPWATMSFTLSQLDVLTHNFENMKDLVKATKMETNCDENEAFRLTFKRFLLHHSAIIRYINLLQATFSGQFSLYLIMSATVIGTTALQFFSIESPMQNFTDVIWQFAFLAIFIAMLYVDCYFGNSITDKCAKISTLIFTCPWTNVDTDQKRTLIILMAKTQRPVVITAIKLVPVSLETFTKVMNWTYKGFAVMNQMK